MIPNQEPLSACDAREETAHNVVLALARVSRDLPSIGRDQKAPEEHGGYAYRGIEQITANVAPLLAKHGVVFIPHVEAIEIRERMLNQAMCTDTILTVRYRICGPGGAQDFVEAVVIGIGRDGSDKGANKALTQAYKYALIQTLCIADARDDADGETSQAGATESATRQAIDDLTARIKSLSPDVAASFKEWKNVQNFRWPWSDAAIDTMHHRLDRQIQLSLSTEQAHDPTKSRSPE
jgi:hypothetical protein